MNGVAVQCQIIDGKIGIAVAGVEREAAVVIHANVVVVADAELAGLQTAIDDHAVRGQSQHIRIIGCDAKNI